MTEKFKIRCKLCSREDAEIIIQHDAEEDGVIEILCNRCGAKEWIRTSGGDEFENRKIRNSKKRNH